LIVFADLCSQPSLTQPLLSYTDVQQDCIDAKAAAVLCTGGPCKCKLRDGSGVMEEWLLKHVVPNIHARCGDENQVAKVLALPALWGCFEELDVDTQLNGGPKLAPCCIRDRAMQECQVIQQLEPDVNPVRKASTSVFVCCFQLLPQSLTSVLPLLLLLPCQKHARKLKKMGDDFACCFRRTLVRFMTHHFCCCAAF